ncbi:MAG: MBL fold metallo-hydrolase [Acidimicrobiaceae bacterium]|nr:MBL fold metallo-hydrolase [Acidimicrobiaceae bacterium]
MIFEQHYLECLSQASYFIGDESTGRAVVVDPRRDIAPYLASVEEHGMTIELVLETHFHADFLSGHLEMAEATGAEIAYGSIADPEFPSRKLAHGERISLGEIELEIRHTPGHTPESISIVIYEHGDDAAPYGVLTGDTMFIGDVGRPDLLSSKGVTKEELAGQLYHSLHEQLMTLPDETLLYPGHGAGSSCGKNLSSNTSCSIGVQRENNYAVQPMTKEAFIDVVTEGQTAPPAYFGYDAALNKAIRPLFFEETGSRPLDLAEVLDAQQTRAIVLDSRSPDEFALGHLRGSINVGLAGRYSEFVGGIITAGTPIVIVADEAHENESKTRLARIGFDDVIGHLADPVQAFTNAPKHVVRSSRVEVAGAKAAMAGVADLQVVDVRQPGETADGVIEGATLIALTQLNDRINELDPTKPTLLYCAGGFRSMIASSKLEQAGFTDVTDLLGGYGAWSGAGEPVVVPAGV